MLDDIQRTIAENIARDRVRYVSLCKTITQAMEGNPSHMTAEEFGELYHELSETRYRTASREYALADSYSPETIADIRRLADEIAGDLS